MLNDLHMLRPLLAAALLTFFVGAGDARAQAPGVVVVVPPPPPQLQLTLSHEDAALLRKGEMGIPRYLAGGLLGSAYGVGLGHLVQGRWLEQGWMFTGGEVGGIALAIYGMEQCAEAERTAALEGRRTRCSMAPIVAGFAAFVGFRVWEIIDVWATPMRQNARIRRLRGLQFYAAPTGSRSATAGLGFHF